MHASTIHNSPSRKLSPLNLQEGDEAMDDRQAASEPLQVKKLSHTHFKSRFPIDEISGIELGLIYLSSRIIGTQQAIRASIDVYMIGASIDPTAD